MLAGTAERRAHVRPGLNCRGPWRIQATRPIAGNYCFASRTPAGVTAPVTGTSCGSLGSSG